MRERFAADEALSAPRERFAPLLVLESGRRDAHLFFDGGLDPRGDHGGPSDCGA
jgi:hypothetical protein